jgi:hypothetical protein
MEQDEEGEEKKALSGAAPPLAISLIRSSDNSRGKKTGEIFVCFQS